MQYSDYYNETNDLVNNLTYGSKLNFFKYGIYTNASRKFFDNKLSFSAGIRADEDTHLKDLISLIMYLLEFLNPLTYPKMVN